MTALSLALASEACLVSPRDYAGLDCDETHGCLDGRVCNFAEGLCVFPAADGGADAGGDGGADAGGDGGADAGSDGGADAGSDGGADAGGSDAGSCPPSDAGSALRWSQCRDGFTGLRQGLNGSGVVVELDAQHRLQVTAPGTTLVGPVGIVEGAFLRSPQGRVRGRIRVNTPFDLAGPAIFVQLHHPSTDAGLLEGFMNGPDAYLGWRTFARSGFVGGPTRRVAFQGRVDAGTTYEVDLRWDQTFGQVLYVDGTARDGYVSADGGPTAPTLTNTADQLRLGIEHHDGDVTDAGLSFILSDFELLDEVSFTGL